MIRAQPLHVPTNRRKTAAPSAGVAKGDAVADLWPDSAREWWGRVTAVMPEIMHAAIGHSVSDEIVRAAERMPTPANTQVAAAVLVPFCCDAHGRVSLVFILRPATMRSHANHIAFPGGKIDPDDETAITAALRETEEEIGIAPNAVEVIGTMRPFPTITTNFHITPVIGRLRATAVEFLPNADEVAEILRVPMADLMRPENRRWADADVGGRIIHRLEFVWQGRIIWGATARILDVLVQALPPPPTPPEAGD